MTPRTRRSIVAATLATSAALVGLGGFIAGEAREPAVASRFVRPDAEAAALKACASRSPFVVLDTFGVFRPANIDDVPDIEARGGARLQHGDIVAAVVESGHPGAIAYQTDPRFDVRSLASDFRRLAADIESGRIAKPAAVVSSIVLPVDLRQLNAHRREGAPFTGDDLSTRRREALATLTDGLDPNNLYSAIDSQLMRFAKAGVPVFVAAGNTGPDQTINALALSDGVYAVGSLDREGAATAYTSAPGLVSVWSPGFVVLTEARGGLSVSGGRKVELKGADLPEQRKVIAAFNGHRAADMLLETPTELKSLRFMPPSRQRNRYLWKTLEPGLYRTEDLMAAYGYPEQSGTFIRAMADGPYMHFPTDTIFRTTVDGALIFDPIGDRSEGQLQVADATSFAAPNICASQLFPTRVAAAFLGN